MISGGWFTELGEYLVGLDDGRVSSLENGCEWKFKEHRHEEGHAVRKTNCSESEVDLLKTQESVRSSKTTNMHLQ